MLLELTRKYHESIWEVITNHELESLQKKRRDGNEYTASTVWLHVIPPPVYLTPSTITTSVAAARTKCIPSSFIGVPQEKTDDRTATKTMVNAVENTDNSDINPPAVTMHALSNREEDNPLLTDCKMQTGFRKNI